jgi:hypothetical protein
MTAEAGTTRSDDAGSEGDGDAGTPTVDMDPPVSQVLYGRNRTWTHRMVGLAVGLLAVAGLAVGFDDGGTVVRLTARGTSPIVVACVGIGTVAAAVHAYLNDGALGSIPLPVAPGIGVAAVEIATEATTGGDPGLAVAWYAYQLFFLLALGAFAFAVGLFGRRAVASVRYRN